MTPAEKSQPIKRPHLTFPKEVGELVRDLYGKASCILEYGSGGSTVLAAEMPRKTVFSVESDKQWADNLRAYLATSDQVLSMPVVQHADIGPTTKWGHPQGMVQFRQFHTYPLSIWDREDFVHPDVVLIDGRFRTACFYACLLRAEKPMTVLFDDYQPRESYHAVERIVAPAEVLNRMAVFHVTPQKIPGSDMTHVIGSFVNPS